MLCDYLDGGMGAVCGREALCIHVADALGCMAETNRAL